MKPAPDATSLPDIAAASLPDTITALRVDPAKGLAAVDAAARLQEHGPNEVAETKSHPIRAFLMKF